jgi:hypothetical protein
MSDLARRRLASHIVETTASPSRTDRWGIALAVLGLAVAVIIWRLS